jgi:hypothetical protein
MKKNLKDFVEAGYKKKSEAKNINGYILDEELSTKRNKVYYDPKTGKAVHTIAGTDSMTDWSNNLLIPIGMHEYSNRYKNSEQIQKEANKKYGKSNVDLVTHSQSGNIAENLANKKLVGGNNTTLNPAIIGNHNKDVKVVKSVLDPVSLLTNTTKKDVKIIPKTIDPIAEHSTNILDKTKDSVFKPVSDAFQPVTDVANKTQKKFNKMFGFGIKALKKGDINKIMKYDYEDSSSDEENEMSGCGLDERKIIKKMGSLHKDIAKLHQKHGVRPSVIKGFKALGMGIINSGMSPAVMPAKGPSKAQLKKMMDDSMKPAVMPMDYVRPTKFKGGELFSTAGFQKKGGNDGMTKEETRAAKDKEKYTNAEAMQNANKSLDIYNKGGYNTKKLGFGIKGCGAAMADWREKEKGVSGKDYLNEFAKLKGRGASGKMLKNAAVNSTAGVLNSAANRAMYEMDNRGKKGSGFKKGSQEAKDHMARIRAMRKTK